MNADYRPTTGNASPPLGRIAIFLSAVMIAAGLGVDQVQAATTHDLFHLFTQHIRKQVVADKEAFANVSRCTEWFYKRQKQIPLRAPVEGVAWRPADHRYGAHTSTRSADFESDCEGLYPHGLEDAREAFSRTQSFLSLSLTFYEFALVSDGNDDGEYNATELHDVLRSLDLASDPSTPATTHLTALTDTFDSLHRTMGLDRLMTSMGRLYDQGYRFTGPDQGELHRVME